MAVLQNWNWPGNIRELENMIERMVILSKGRVLAAPPVELDAPQEITDDNLTEMERDHIIQRFAGDQWRAVGSGWGGQPAWDQAHYAAVDAQAIRN